MARATRMLALMLTATLATTATFAARVVAGDETAEATPPQNPDYGGARPGWYVALGAVGTHLALNTEAKQAFEDAGIGFDARGRGGELELGYAFSQVFALELHLIGARHEASRPDREVNSGLVQLEAVTQLLSHGHVRPYLAGGLGGASVDAGSTRIGGGQVDMGGGLELHVSRRFAFSFNYRYCIQNYEKATLSVSDTLREDVEIDSSGETHVWGFRGTFSF